MNKKKINHIAKKLEEYYSQFPDWYWKYGLHDAKVLPISELELAPDWKQKIPQRKCLELYFDSHNAMFEQDIVKIRLYDYEIKTSELNFNSLEELWWLDDTLTQLSDEHFLLRICFGTAGDSNKQLNIEFASAEIERK